MQRLKLAFSWIVLAALIGVLAEASLLLDATRATVAAIPGEIQATRAALLSAVSSADAHLDAELGGVRRDLVGQSDAWREDTLERVDTFTRVAASELTTANGTLADAAARLEPAAEAALGHAGTTIQQAQALLATADKGVADLHPQLLGLVAAAKVTAGETAQTMRTVRDAMPQVLVTVQDIGKHVDATTEASQRASEKTAEIMTNFATATKPLPKPLRLGLQIGGPVAMAAYYISMMLMALGAI